MLESLKNLSNFMLDATRELCMRIVLAFCLFFSYVVVSMILYAIMRQFLVPQKTHVLPVHLMFSPSCPDSDHTVHVPHKPHYVQQPLDIHSSYKCPSFPNAKFYLANGNYLLSPGQVYTVAIELDLPESSTNEHIGMFMVNLTFYSYSGSLAATSVRPTVLHYKSNLLRIFSTIFYSLPLILGFTEEKQRQVLTMMENYQEPYTDGTVIASVTILSSNVQLYNVELTIDAVFTGLSYYLYHWPISMAVIIITGLFFSLSMVTVLVWARQFLEKLDRFRYRRRHSSLRMTLRASGLDPIPEEDEQRHRPQVGIEDISVTDSRTDPLETGSTVSTGTEVTSDISELDHSLQAHREQLEAEGGNPLLIGGMESSTPIVTDSEDSNRDEGGLRQRKT